MNVRFAGLAFFLATVPLPGQELGLGHYLERLKLAPGVTVEDRVRFLSEMGVTLSEEGVRDLNRAASVARNNAALESSPGGSTTRKGTQSWKADNDDNWMTRRKSVWSRGDSFSSPRPSSSVSNQVGDFTYYNFDNGVSGTSNRVGNFTYHNFSNGVSGTSSKVGRFIYHSFSNGLSGTSHQVGDFTYENFNNGLSGTRHRVGNFTYQNYSDGTSCTTNRAGRFSYTNCNR